MIDYAVFDALLDSVFVINEDKQIEYCNEAAASLSHSSVRRLSKGKYFFETIVLKGTDLFPTEHGKLGEIDAVPFTEVEYSLSKENKSGKIQVAIQPFNDEENKKWIIVIRDVTLEEVLYGKYRKELEGKEKLIVELQQAQAELEKYSKGLEKMVEERTHELNSVNRTLSAIMNSLGQGFLVFGADGQCGDVYTKVCEEIVEAIPANKSIFEILKADGKEKATLKSWLGAMFSEALPFDSMKELGPSTFNHSQGRHISLDYHAIRNENTNIENVVMVATDKTEEVEANIALDKERSFAQMVLKIVGNTKHFSKFLESCELIKIDLENIVTSGQASFDYGHCYRLLHTLEGEAAIFSIRDLVLTLKQLQQILEPLKHQDSPETRINVFRKFEENLYTLDQSIQKFLEEQKDLLDAVGVGSSQLMLIKSKDIESLLNYLRTQNLSEEIFSMVVSVLAKEEFGDGFQTFQAAAKDVATIQGKQLYPIKLDGLKFKVFLNEYQGFLSSLVHVFRNAVDHGLEAPEERVMLGKPPAGQIEVCAEKFEKTHIPWIRLYISDDGSGIDPAKIRSKLRDLRPETDWDLESDHNIIQHIFDAGLSSRTEISEFSGRGIGMDAVKFEVEKLGGTIVVNSQLGHGTKICVEIPEIVSSKVGLSRAS